MKKTGIVNNLKKAAAVFMTATLLAAPLSTPLVYGAGPTGYEPVADSLITKLDKPLGGYEEYLDSSVIFELNEGIEDDQEISVIVTLDGTTVMDAYDGSDKTMSFADFAVSDAARDIKAGIAESKKSYLSALDEKKISYTAGEEYSTVLNGFEILIKAGDFEEACKSLGRGMDVIVGEEYQRCETELVENTVNVFDTGIFKSEESGYDGSGIVVAVLDTGLDSNHTAFSPDNFTSKQLGLTYEDVANVIEDTDAAELVDGLSVDDVYINEKVPFGFDYADEDSDVYSTHNNHGTHVSGVIVGNDDTIRGVAPNAQLVSMKIFSDVMDTARTAWILSALEDCVILGVDVINMSIGTACGFGRATDEEAVDGIYDRIRESGINMIVAASNSYNSAYGSEKNGNLGLTSNPDTGTVGSPSTYEGVMSVASIAGVETPYLLHGDTIIYFTESANATGDENDFCETLLGDDDSKTLEYVVVPGVGRSADYTGIDVEGKIALVRRGSNTFEEKAMIAQEKGAAGIIIYNNVSGDIRMNVKDATIAVCSISQDDGELLAKENGKLKISSSQTSGPFISDFSSWGPTPDLQLKPEITAHGGSILSSVTGGGYDRLSGTSMACPNLAGVVILVRQYVVENFPEIADDNNKVSAMVYNLLMSTADIALNTNGLPYSVRKQGAGLANLMSTITTPAYISTKDADGNETDKAKLELGDDPEKTGVYEMTFTLNNFGEKKVSYELGSYVMTEGVSETKTNAGETTVTEEAYILEGASFEVIKAEGGKLSGDKVTVKAGESAEITVKITLSDEDKKYLDDSFENGMYVEGFITLKAKSGSDIDLNVPYLAYYGDWTKAPLFDLTFYDTNADELDDGIDFEDKVMADAYATRPVGGVNEDYVSYLGSYYFLQDPEDMVIAADENYIALSNKEGTVHSLRFVWAGMLRNAAKIDITITNDATGEVVLEKTEEMVRKSYSDGGASIYPANVEIEFDTQEYNFANNTTFTVKLVGYLDYGEDGGLTTNENNVFEFPMTMDFEAPTVTDVEYYYEYDKTAKKNKLYADVLIYDNHYAMSSQIGYVTTGTDEEGNVASEMIAFEQYLTPVYSERNSTTRVTYDITDYLFDIKNSATNKNSFVITTYDYALNYATYEIRLPDSTTDIRFDDIGEEGLTLSVNEVYTLDPTVEPITAWAEMLEYSSSKPKVARVVNNKLIAVSEGTSIIKAQDPVSNKSVTFTVTVLGEEDEGYVNSDKPVTDVFTLDGFTTTKAYYVVENDDKDIGDTGSRNFFEGKYSLTMYPSETVVLNYSLDPYFPKDTQVVFESSNENIVTIDETGKVTGVDEGFASVTVKVLMDDKSTYYSETVSVEIKDPYITSGPSLTHYYGNGGLVDVPAKLKLTEIGQFAFSNFEYVMKTEEELAFDDAEKSKAWYIGDNTITKVVLPEGIEKINAYAFANLTALEEIVLPSTLQAIEYGAFYGCTSLETITFSSENNLQIISQNAFENCDLRGTLKLDSICVISDYAFAGNQKLKGIEISDTLLSVGQYAFAGCKALSEVKIEADKVKYGAYAFNGCESLTEFYVNSAVIPEGMFYECDDMISVTVGPDVKDIGAFAFRETEIKDFIVDEANKTYKPGKAAYILSADTKTLAAVSPTFKGAFGAKQVDNAEITAIGKGAFSHNLRIESINLPKVTSVGDYGLSTNEYLTKITLGKLTEIGEYAYFETGITELPKFDAETKIGKYAFSYTKLTSVTVPDNMKIAEGTFSELVELTTVVIGNNVELGKYAFSLNRNEAFDVVSEDVGDEKQYHYEFNSPLTSLTIGENAIIGENAFNNAAKLEAVTLGAGAELGKMAFYNNSSLKEIDLSKVKKIGDYAISGDVYYACLDSAMSTAAVSSEGQYLYTYHGPKVTSLDVSSAESIGEYAFSYCRQLVDIKLNPEIKEIPQYCFAGCDSLKTINLTAVTKIGDYAFMECGLENVDISAAESVGEYGFVSCRKLKTVTLNPEGSDIGEGAFSYCDPLATVKNLNAVKNIGDYAFAYDAITNADLTAAEAIGTNAFMKEELTDFTVTLGEDLEKIGDNPFAMCKLKPFSIMGTEEINDTEIEAPLYDYEISDTVQIIDGSLYCMGEAGLELVAFAGVETEDVELAEGTVRITTMAFAGSDVVRVKLPYTTTAVGHKAFYQCNKLEMVIFGSHTVPVFEEEFDPTYYECYEHIPGTGSYGTYTDYNGNEVEIKGSGMLPYYMWNATDGLYSNVFYGANFVDYVGYVENKLTMVHPINGVGYDSYICNQYFDLRIEGPAAPDKVACVAIAAINAIPERVTLDDAAKVKTARDAYGKIATTEQQALVTNYSALVSAEQRIAALSAEAEEGKEEAKTEKGSVNIALIITVVAVVLVFVAVAVVFVLMKKGGARKKNKTEEKAENNEENK